MNTGYARVPALDQNLKLQLDARNKAGYKTIFQEKASGATKARPERDRMLAGLRTGDTFYIYQRDRLSHSLKHLLDMVAELEFRGLGLVSLTDAINTTLAQGRLVFTPFASLAEFERKLVRERPHAGLASARARGRVSGRRRELSEEVERTAIASRDALSWVAARDERDCPAPAHLQGHALSIPASPGRHHSWSLKRRRSQVD